MNIEEKDINEWTVKEFQALPRAVYGDDIKEIASLIILPTGKVHDSGFGTMDFVAVNKDGKPIARLSGHSDVLCIDWYNDSKKLWSIDCLKKSKLLRIFLLGSKIEYTQGSAFMINAKK